MSDAPLAGIRVVELAQMVAGPGAGLLLADYGADVVKVEPPSGDGARHLRSPSVQDVAVSPVFSAYNRDKTIVTADLRDPHDCEAVRRLCADADVVLVSSRPGVMDRLGLGAEAVRQLNPEVVYASVTGFGRGPIGATRGGVDIVVQAESGMMSTTGAEGGPPLKTGFTIVDAAAAHALTHGILAALVRRGRTGTGDLVEVSLYDVAVHLQTGPLAEFLHSSRQTPRLGNAAPLAAPADLFLCADRPIVLSAYLPHHWAALLECLGLEHLGDDPRFVDGTSRSRHRVELTALLAARLATRPADEWLAGLTTRGVLAAPVQDHAAVVASDLTHEAQILIDRDGVKGVATPVRMRGIGTTHHAADQRPMGAVTWKERAHD